MLDLDDCSSMPNAGKDAQHAEQEMEAMRQQLEQLKAQQVRRVTLNSVPD
jgi:hypothetical protein